VRRSGPMLSANVAGSPNKDSNDLKELLHVAINLGAFKLFVSVSMLGLPELTFSAGFAVPVCCQPVPTKSSGGSTYSTEPPPAFSRRVSACAKSMASPGVGNAPSS
jgi:hypothetical protein